jgi:hypothetical protein
MATASQKDFGLARQSLATSTTDHHGCDRPALPAEPCRHDKQRRERETSERQFERPNPFSAKVLMLCKRICSA